MYFTFTQQLVYGAISVLQDAFAEIPVSPQDFKDGKYYDKAFNEFRWTNDKNAKDQLIITEAEPFEDLRMPQISVTFNSGDMKNLSFNQFQEEIVENGKVVGHKIGGGGEFQMMFRCASESTEQRKKLADLTMALLLINREEFASSFGIIAQDFRFSSTGSQPFLESDRKIYWQDITVKFYGEWEFDIKPEIFRLTGFNQTMRMYRSRVNKVLSLKYNVVGS